MRRHSCHTREVVHIEIGAVLEQYHDRFNETLPRRAMDGRVSKL
jgi:hypothetical protein